MAVDKNKVTAEATKLVQKGQLDKAIRAYDRILAEDPKDVRVLLKIGELHGKKGDPRAAAAAFGRAADAYAEQGFFLKAVAVNKQMLKLAPDDARVNERLAGLYQQLGILSDAMAQLQLVAAAAERAGDGAKVLAVLRRMVEIDPENVGTLVKLGELHANAGQGGAALEHLRKAAARLEADGRADEYLRVAERIATLDEDDLPLTRKLASLHLARGDTKRALSRLQSAFKADPEDLETLALLARAFEELGQTGKTVSVLRERAHLLGAKGQLDEAAASWRRVLELAPRDDEAAEALRRPVARARFPEAPPRPPGTPEAPPASAAVLPPTAAPERPRQPPSAPRPGARAEEAIPKLLIEIDVYAKYGLHEKALEHLARIFALDPDSLEGHEKALQLRSAHGEVGPATEEALAVARLALARDLPDRARAAVDSLRVLSPAHPLLQQLAAAASLAVSGPGGGSGVGADSMEEEILVDDLVLEGELVATEGLGAEGDPWGEEVEEGVVADGQGDADGAPPEDLGDELAEADFFVGQGLFDEARELLEELRAAHPGHPQVAAAMAKLELRLAPAAPEGEELVDAHGVFDIGRELAQELEAAPPGPPTDEFQFSVQDVFTQFKRGVEETVLAGDSATHYDLAIAYKEMGLLDDALHELEVALGGDDRSKDVDCLTMIALCSLEKGDATGAVAAFRRALSAEGLADGAARAIRYELALAYEKMSQPEQALFLLHGVVREDPGYRDAAAALARLGGGPGQPLPPEEPPAGGA